jgi:hypothetical protein
MRNLPWLAVALLFTINSWAEETKTLRLPSEYSVVWRASASGQETISKVFVSGGKLRSEVTVAGQKMVAVFRQDEGFIYHCMSGQKKFTKMSVKSDFATVSMPPNAEWKLFGTEEISGETFDKYQTDGIFLGKIKQVALWVNRETGVPLKHKFEGITFEWSNFQKGPQPENLFDVSK